LPDGKTRERRNNQSGKARKLAALNSFFGFLLKRGLIPANAAALLDAPKRREKNFVILNAAEAADLLDNVDSGAKLPPRAKSIHHHLRSRDLAIVTMLLGTGMRVSELVGINISHVDMDERAVKVTRKGGKESILYYGDETDEALRDYLAEREEIDPLPGHGAAMFLSLQRRRITVRAVENLVRKYSRLVTEMKTISPHKLRGTFGTNLYRETGDIFLVASVLGHSDVNTTTAHYARVDEETRRSSVKYTKLRE
jgi:site-specific recombinase XerD